MSLRSLAVPATLTLMMVGISVGSSGADDAKEPEAIRLFNGTDLSGFYTFIKNEQPEKNSDPAGVFSVSDGLLRISGERVGYLATEKSYDNYRLVAEFKWGEYLAPGKGKGRDSGLFIHMQVEDALFPKSLEFQMQQGVSGDLCLIRGAEASVAGETKNKSCFSQPAKPFAIEKPLGEWNTIEIISRDGKLEYKLNGQSLLKAENAKPASGKIYLQCFNAELFYRRVDLYPLSEK